MTTNLTLITLTTRRNEWITRREANTTAGANAYDALRCGRITREEYLAIVERHVAAADWIAAGLAAAEAALAEATA